MIPSPTPATLIFNVVTYAIPDNCMNLRRYQVYKNAYAFVLISKNYLKNFFSVRPNHPFSSVSLAIFLLSDI